MTPGPIDARGAFTGDFTIDHAAAPASVPDAIDRDRRIMSRRRGMLSKHVPIQVNDATGEVFCGGRYLFSEYADARDYHFWMHNEFADDGIPFPERPYFVRPVFSVWSVIGAYQFTAPEEHVAIRLERWRAVNVAPATLERAYAGALDRARRQGLAGIWLLHAPYRNEVGLVTISGRSATWQSGSPDAASFSALAHSTPLLPSAALQDKCFDRTGWVWNVWLPGASSAEDGSLWPNSPPLPAVPGSAPASSESSG